MSADNKVEARSSYSNSPRSHCLQRKPEQLNRADQMLAGRAEPLIGQHPSLLHHSRHLGASSSSLERLPNRAFRYPRRCRLSQAACQPRIWLTSVCSRHQELCPWQTCFSREVWYSSSLTGSSWLDQMVQPKDYRPSHCRPYLNPSVVWIEEWIGRFPWYFEWY